MFDVKEKPEMVERALLVRISLNRREEKEDEALLEELEELVTTLGVGIEEAMLVRARSEHKKFICGTGKAEEIATYAKAIGCDVVVFDNMLSPMQQRAWEEITEITVIDREEVILDIFAGRAQTKEAQLQVELARMQYALPRMKKMWGHLDREGGSGGGTGGGGASRGMGEKQIEVDRRLARNRIEKIKSELAVVRKQRKTRRKERERFDTPHASVVGYTNAGKSTLLNRLSGSDVLVKDMLFATLDTTTRKIDLPDGQPLLVTDTVGFVRNLPTRLVEAFKATLEEAVLADFLMHVLDASSEQAVQFHQTTMEILAELGADDKKMITVLNKVDLVEDPAHLSNLEERFPNTVLISAVTGQGIEHLEQKCAEMLLDRISCQDFRIPQRRGDLVSLLHKEAKIIATDYEGADVLITAAVSPALAGKLKEFRIPEKGEQAALSEKEKWKMA